MAAKPFNWGLMSTARINRALIPPLNTSPRNHLQAVASRSLEKARVYAETWHIPKAYGSYEALLADQEIEAVYISLPNHLHTAWTIRAVQAGKHVLCEKPLALSVSDVDCIMEAAHTAGVTVAEAFMYRHHPQTLRVKELIDEGAIGTLQLVRGSFSFYLDRPKDIRLDPAMGGGSLWDIGCYPVSYARFLAGQEPEEVFGWQVQGETGVDLVFAGGLRFPDGVLAQIDSSFRAPLRTQIEVVGTQGSIQVNNPFKPGLDDQILLYRDGELQRIVPPGQELYLGEVEDLADAALHGKAPRIPLEDSRGNVATIVALLESARVGRPVGLPGKM